VAVLPLDPQLTPTRITLLRHRQFPLRPAVQAFETFLHESFGPQGAFAMGLIAPPRIDRMERSSP
jgi:DNA-binding transcriptional LysR family regulator